MVDITVLELHLHDAEFTANAPFSDDSEADDGTEGGEGAGGRSVGLLGVVVGLCTLALLAVGLKRLLSDATAED